MVIIRSRVSRAARYAEVPKEKRTSSARKANHSVLELTCVAKRWAVDAVVAQVVCSAWTVGAAGVVSSVDKTACACQALCALETSQAWELTCLAQVCSRV